MQETLTREQFCERFVAHMTKQSPFTCFKNEDGTDAETVAEYAIRLARAAIAAL